MRIVGLRFRYVETFGVGAVSFVGIVVNGSELAAVGPRTPRHVRMGFEGWSLCVLSEERRIESLPLIKSRGAVFLEYSETRRA